MELSPPSSQQSTISPISPKPSTSSTIVPPHQPTDIESSLLNTNTLPKTYANVSMSAPNPTTKMPSTYSNVSQNNSSNPFPNQIKVSHQNVYKKPDYSNDNLKTPKKDQGLIIESAEGLKIKQYLQVVGEIIGPENIMYASRLSRDRICMYLKSKLLVNEITENFDYIQIDEHNLAVRPLTLRATKYFLNRVCPSIPGSFLHDKISEIGINITSMIIREKMTNDDDGYSHIYSFRRTFYGIPGKNINIPDSILINFENENHRIFLSTEIKKCEYCKKIGHTSEKCRKKLLDDTLLSQQKDDLSDSLSLSMKDSAFHLSSSSLNTETDDMETELIDINENTQNTITSLSTEQTQLSSAQLQVNNKNLHGVQSDGIGNKIHGSQFKTPKVPNSDGMYVELQKKFNEAVNSQLSFEFFISFVIKLSKKKINDDEIRKQYGSSIKDLTEITETLRGITYSATKARLTRTLYKSKNIFKISYPKDKQSIDKIVISNESENHTMEHM